ncbi:MAG: lysophospholipid acyltransferase family protein [Deltaproteobacteria bacterium]|nr:lysophospholipid acyltransferase family protein [Deltaproteobacteria bacterium]
MSSLVAIFQWIVASLSIGLYSFYTVFLYSLFPRRPWVRHSNRFFCRWILFLVRVHVQIEGLEFVDPKKVYVICSNHQGMFDTFAINGLIPQPMTWLSKPGYFKIPFVGWVLWASRHVLVTRTDKERDRQAIALAVEQLHHGIPMAVFPEGTRSRDGTLGPFKFGAFRMAKESGCWVLPVVLHGSGEKLKKGEWKVRSGTIRMVILPPIDPKNLSVEELCDKTHQMTLETLNRLS